MSDKIAVKVKGLSKTFILPHEKQSSIKGALISGFRGGKRLYEKQEVLKNVSFDIKKGEFFGIVGRNGSGKSTLLKLLAGIYHPTQGSIEIHGKLTPFIELGVGFNPELTGRENVYLNGALLGFSRKEMQDLYDDIVSFAEIERFMDQKLKNYSSGMQVRLAFSIAIRTNTDILILDEVLAVGDAAFQKKCFDYFMQLKKDKKTVVLVTHDMGAVRQYCDRAIMIEKGVIVKSGSTEKVAQAYQKLFNDEIAKATQPGNDNNDKRWGTGKLKAEDVAVVQDKQEISVSVTYRSYADVEPPVFGFNIFNSRGMNMLEGNTIRKKVTTKALHEGEKAKIKWSFPNMLATDTYTVSVSTCDESVTEFYDWYNEAETFIIAKDGNTAAVADPYLTVDAIEYAK